MGSDQYLDTAKDLARQAGAVMKKNFVLHMNQEWKDDNTPVTATDLTINALVLKTIEERFPGHSILSEEGDSFSADSEHVWICDPVDGTHNFSHGIPTATFALGLTVKGESVLGVIYDPFLDRMFWAEKEKGAFMNGKQIRVSDTPTVKRTVVGMGKMKSVRNLYPVMEAIKEHSGVLITGLSIHYMNALVACGEFSAAFFGGTSPHDMSVSKIIVEEAGGRATNLFGKEESRYDRDMEGQLCSNGVLHDELMALMDRVSPVKEKVV